jgi:hypothetical protein
VTAWVAIALVHIAVRRADRDGLPEFRPGRLRPLTAGAGVWVVASVVGITLTEQKALVRVAQLAPIITVALAAGLYYAALKFAPSAVRARGDDPRDEVPDVWEARIRCHACERSYVAVEMDRDPSANGAAICAACAADSSGLARAVRAGASKEVS